MREKKKANQETMININWKTLFCAIQRHIGSTVYQPHEPESIHGIVWTITRVTHKSFALIHEDVQVVKTFFCSFKCVI